MSDTNCSKTEKPIAREAFEKAYMRECADLADKVRAKAEKIAQPDDIWSLHDFLKTKRKEIDEK